MRNVKKMINTLKEGTFPNTRQSSDLAESSPQLVLSPTALCLICQNCQPIEDCQPSLQMPAFSTIQHIDKWKELELPGF